MKWLTYPYVTLICGIVIIALMPFTHKKSMIQFVVGVGLITFSLLWVANQKKS